VQSLAYDVWQAAKRQHVARVQPWTRDRVERSLRGEKHPVYDFLFEYYHFRPAHLERYSPGINVLLEGATTDTIDWPERYIFTETRGYLGVDLFPAHRLPGLTRTRQLLQATLERPPVYHCFGLHEWAMVYRSDEVRHQQVPLRLSMPELASFVESQQLVCTHFDAFRFFTPAAVPRNRHQLTRLSMIDHDQPGCIHATMDLYKWCYQFAPYISSELTADCFALARTAREIDMRASPYDLPGFPPIRIETKAGREEYIEKQRELYEIAQPLRKRVLAAYGELEGAIY
jgi:hypothetical protein